MFIKNIQKFFGNIGKETIDFTSLGIFHLLNYYRKFVTGPASENYAVLLSHSLSLFILLSVAIFYFPLLCSDSHEALAIIGILFVFIYSSIHLNHLWIPTSKMLIHRSRNNRERTWDIDRRRILTLCIFFINNFYRLIITIVKLIYTSI